ncbi:MAG: ABC transporter ATP-binding protein [Planctomyces sp.]|jgi:ABC-2 type transport system ATP-binding protein
MTSMISLQNVTRLYGTVLGVNDISLELPCGAWGLLGPNGAGKSTLLNLLIGQLKPTRGRVEVLGMQPRNNAALMRRLGFCPGFEGMYASVSGLDWVTFLLQMQGRSTAAARRRAIECMEQVGMQESMGRPIASYSRGMRQRTKLAQAISHEPELLILDEPFSGLDPIGRSQMTDLLRSWIREGRSIVIASHVLHEIEALTQSFLLISGGRLLASGTSEEVHELLYQVPMELHLRCTKARRIAALVLETGLADSVTIQPSPVIHSEHGSSCDLLRISTRSAEPLASALMNWIPAEQVTVLEFRTADDSLQSLFNSLMKIHRGEL